MEDGLDAAEPAIVEACEEIVLVEIVGDVEVREIGDLVAVGEVVDDEDVVMEAGRRAGLSRGWLVDGEASDQDGFKVSPLRDRDDLDGLLATIRML